METSNRAGESSGEGKDPMAELDAMFRIMCRMSDDPDYLFVVSLLREIKTVPPSRRLAAKSRVYGVLAEEQRSADDGNRSESTASSQVHMGVQPTPPSSETDSEPTDGATEEQSAERAAEDSTVQQPEPVVLEQENQAAQPRQNNRKYNEFVNERMGEKNVLSVPGIGEKSGEKLRRRGYSTAVSLAGVLRSKRNRWDFETWLKRFGLTSARSSECYEALSECLRKFEEL